MSISPRGGDLGTPYQLTRWPLLIPQAWYISSGIKRKSQAVIANINCQRLVFTINSHVTQPTSRLPPARFMFPSSAVGVYMNSPYGPLGRRTVAENILVFIAPTG